ncbi:MAG: hypothetical protein Fur0022_14020 [Anaerolineales bacterium]
MPNKDGNAAVIFTNGKRGMGLCERIIRRTLGVEHPAFLWV